jgi:hypothetical protein
VFESLRDSGDSAGRRIARRVAVQAEKESLSHLHFLDLLLGAQADARRERTVARRIREARFADGKTLEGYNWLHR